MQSDPATVTVSRIIDYTALSTEPGAYGPFAPPEGWRGPEPVYRKRIREAIMTKRDRLQQLYAIQHRELSGADIGFTGPYAEAASEVYKELRGISE